MIDDENFPGAILRFKFQAKLLLDRCEERRPRRIARGRAASYLLAACRSLAHTCCPSQREIIVAFKPGPILNDAPAQSSR